MKFPGIRINSQECDDSRKRPVRHFWTSSELHPRSELYQMLRKSTFIQAPEKGSRCIAMTRPDPEA